MIPVKCVMCVDHGICPWPSYIKLVFYHESEWIEYSYWKKRQENRFFSIGFLKNYICDVLWLDRHVIVGERTRLVASPPARGRAANLRMLLLFLVLLPLVAVGGEGEEACPLPDSLAQACLCRDQVFKKMEEIQEIPSWGKMAGKFRTRGAGGNILRQWSSVKQSKKKICRKSEERTDEKRIIQNL